MSLDTVFRLAVAPLKCLSTARLDSMNPGSLKVNFPSHDNVDIVMSKNCRQKVRGRGYFWLIFYFYFYKNIHVFIYLYFIDLFIYLPLFLKYKTVTIFFVFMYIICLFIYFFLFYYDLLIDLFVYFS